MMKFFWHICMAVGLMSVFSAAHAGIGNLNLPEGVVAAWVAGDEGDVVPDISGGGHDGELFGEERKPERVSSDFLGNVLHFTHVGRSGGPVVGISVSDAINPPRPEMTVAAWVKLDEGGRRNHNYILCSRHGSSSYVGGGGYEFRVFFGRLMFDYRTEAGENLRFQVDDDHIIMPGNWHFVAVTHDGEKVNLYIDAVQVLSEEAREYPYPSSFLAMGNFRPGHTSHTFHGKIGPVVMFNRALPSEEIFSMMASFVDAGL